MDVQGCPPPNAPLIQASEYWYLVATTLGTITPFCILGTHQYLLSTLQYQTAWPIKRTTPLTDLQCPMGKAVLDRQKYLSTFSSHLGERGPTFLSSHKVITAATLDPGWAGGLLKTKEGWRAHPIKAFWFCPQQAFWITPTGVPTFLSPTRRGGQRTPTSVLFTSSGETNITTSTKCC